MTEIHANTEQLLEIKDGLQNDACTHVRNCHHCQQELDALCALQQEIFATAEQAPRAEIWDGIVSSAARPEVRQLFNAVENDRSGQRVPVELLAATSLKAANDSSLSKAIYSLAASILVTGFIGLYIFGQQGSDLQQAKLFNANIQQLMLNSRGMENALQQVSLQNELLTVDEQSAAERLYWRLTYVDQLIHETSVEESSDTEQIEQLWKNRIDALRELNQLYYQRQQTLDDSVI